ncbi:MAG: DUF58 domain-containing protein [Deltaproteobacteria bacterium]|nr:DUF58 domain-containing protein [Deltaproteobacteria bacterium]
MSPFFVFVLVIIMMSALLRVDFFFTILYLFVGIYMVLRIWSDRITRNLFVQRDFLTHAFVGDEIRVNLKIRNQSRLPIPWLMVNEAIHWRLATTSSLRQVTSLKGKEDCGFTYRLKAKRRGYYKVGPTVVHTGDILGLRPDFRENLDADYLVVYPKIIPLVELGLPTHSPQAVLPAALPIFEDPAHITGIRGYNWGDNPRHIHWPATAITGKVMIKQFRPAVARESAIFLNLTRSDYTRRYREPAIELAITTAASLAYHILTKEKLPVGFYTTAMDPFHREIEYFQLPPVKEQHQLPQILDILARIEPIDSGEFLKNLRHKAVHLSWGSTVIVISGERSNVLSEALIWLKHQGLHPVLVLVEMYREPKRLKTEPIPTFEIGQEKDIETWGLTP